MKVTLSKPIRPGFRRAFEVRTDEPVDKMESGLYARSEVVTGDSSPATILPDTSPEASTRIAGFINGDGALGKKQVNVIVDAHVNAGEVPLVLEIEYEVDHPDATAFSGFKEADTDEAIPPKPA